MRNQELWRRFGTVEGSIQDAVWSVVELRWACRIGANPARPHKINEPRVPIQVDRKLVA